ncbi:hypothetical protein L226DRAFT_487136 [Lentinus tigrinus ALCF2SS1-7]|uniref:Peroxisomal biogenesis factor 11 n=1 Tax=Lentinus tigrinus ALCF2SS1-6 TaxID=1328759 RepID=A0A5C2SF71_9APHY|nr:hypothetical protein L227DRAFT_573776 [Lentinus tigrinus ALCF2SS1-6]RPD74400.1 hypothetical protein L226DRAFT_487136 [Lentinus tigrinus ALCF2SS1-7]
MSSITFPYGSGHASSSSFISAQDSTSSLSTVSYEPPNDTSSFQMNPLSSHPPRTPRTSIMSNGSHVFGTDVYDTKEDAQVTHTFEADESASESEDGEKVGADHPRVRKEEVWRELLKSANGRDKALKLLQYSMKMYLVFHFAITASPAFRGRNRPGWEAELTHRLKSGIAGFSLTRKCLILFNWLPPLTSILAQHQSDSYVTHKGKQKPLLHTFLHAPPPVLLEFVNGLADDAATFSRLGLIGKRTGERAGRLADWCWFASTLVNMVENSVERSVILDLQHQVEGRLYSESMSGATSKSNPAANKLDEKELARLQRQDYWIQITRLKLLMDLIFVSYDVFRLKRAKGQVQTLAGLASAVLSTAKLYDRHKSSLIKGVSH